MRYKIILLLALSSLLFLNTFIYTQEFSISGIVEKASPSIVQIIIYDITGTERTQGTAFFIAPGKILTNSHIVEDAYSAEIYSEIEYYNQIIILKIDKEVDLALLDVEVHGEAFLTLEENQEIRPGQRIITIGNPMGLEKTISDGLVSAMRGIPGGIQIIQISAPISPGSSGGPLLNMDGHVIGVTSAMLSEGQNLNFAIGIETINNFLNSPDNPQILHEARSRVLWRTILKRVESIILALIALVFSGGIWVIILIIVFVISIIGGIFKGLFRLIKAPFQKKKKDNLEKYGFISDPEPYEQLDSHESENEEVQFATSEEENIEDTDTFTFHCWKCGEEVEADSIDRPEKVECWNCGTTLLVPIE